jgi:hypothetical protein
LKQVHDGPLAEAPGFDGFIVLDHDAVVLVNGYDGGGGRARPARWKISKMTIRLPQQGHGGRRSGSEPASSSSVRAWVETGHRIGRYNSAPPGSPVDWSVKSDTGISSSLAGSRLH